MSSSIHFFRNTYLHLLLRGYAYRIWRCMCSLSKVWILSSKLSVTSSRFTIPCLVVSCRHICMIVLLKTYLDCHTSVVHPCVSRPVLRLFRAKGVRPSVSVGICGWIQSYCLLSCLTLPERLRNLAASISMSCVYVRVLMGAAVDSSFRTRLMLSVCEYVHLFCPVSLLT